MNQYQIISAHWSTNPKDSHSADDEDCTYVIEDVVTSKLYGIFNKFAEAQEFISNNLA